MNSPMREAALEWSNGEKHYWDSCNGRPLLYPVGERAFIAGYRAGIEAAADLVLQAQKAKWESFGKGELKVKEPIKLVMEIRELAEDGGEK